MARLTPGVDRQTIRKSQKNLSDFSRAPASLVGVGDAASRALANILTARAMKCAKGHLRRCLTTPSRTDQEVPLPLRERVHDARVTNRAHEQFPLPLWERARERGMSDKRFTLTPTLSHQGRGGLLHPLTPTPTTPPPGGGTPPPAGGGKQLPSSHEEGSADGRGWCGSCQPIEQGLNSLRAAPRAGECAGRGCANRLRVWNWVVYSSALRFRGTSCASTTAG